MGSVLQSIGNTWHQLNPNEPFEYSFLNEDFQKNYEADNRLAGIVQNFTIIAILISCLGFLVLPHSVPNNEQKKLVYEKY